MGAEIYFHLAESDEFILLKLVLLILLALLACCSLSDEDFRPKTGGGFVAFCSFAMGAPVSSTMFDWEPDF